MYLSWLLAITAVRVLTLVSLWDMTLAWDSTMLSCGSAKNFLSSTTNPENIPGSSDNILNCSTDIKNLMQEWPDTPKLSLFSRSSGSLEPICCSSSQQEGLQLSRTYSVSPFHRSFFLEKMTFGKLARREWECRPGQSGITVVPWHSSSGRQKLKQERERPGREQELGEVQDGNNRGCCRSQLSGADSSGKGDTGTCLG